jgi:hypothetical protein
MFEPLTDFWNRIRRKQTTPVVVHEEEEQVTPELTEGQILEQIFHKLKKPREVVLITINDAPNRRPTLSVEDDFTRNWDFPSLYKQAYGNSLFQRIVVIPWRWNTQGGGVLKRSRLTLPREWGAWMVAGIPHGDDIEDTEIYVRIRGSKVNMVHPVTRATTKLNNGLIAHLCLILGCRIVESHYFKQGFIYRLEPSVKRNFYMTYLGIMDEVKDVY